MHRFSLIAPALLALAACGPTAPPISAPPPPLRDSAPAVGLDRVMGQTAPTITGLFGPPALDIREGQGRKLQYRSPACVLDAYLYAQAGGGDAKVSWIDTRTPNGTDFDRASCIASLARAEPLKPARTVPAAARPGRRKR
jgi:hypothetical protein